MARGRFLSKKISWDLDVSRLSTDTCRLAFTWTLAHLDCEGRTFGDPLTLLHTVFPRRSDLTADDMAGFMAEWASAGMVVWYEAGGDRWLSFPHFEQHQQGLRKDRETPSVIPSPDGAELLRTYSGPTPELLPPNVREGKVRKEKSNTMVAAASAAESEGFTEFYSTYPRKVAKQAAVKAYRTAIKTTDAATILAGLKRWLPSVAGKDPQYIPHPATWLNAGRWADEPEPPSTNGRNGKMRQEPAITGTEEEMRERYKDVEIF